MAAGRYKRYGRRSTTRRRFRNSYSSRAKRSYSRAKTVASAAGVTEAVWSELNEADRINLLTKKRDAVASAIERNVVLGQIMGRTGSQSAKNLFDAITDDKFKVDIVKLARTDH
jgi:hypothetical protein